MIDIVTLKNYCQFDDRTFHFYPGVNCIRGRNGSGKSNLLRAIRFALTGRVSGRNLDDMVRKSDSLIADSFVEVRLVTADGPVYVKRQLRPRKVSMDFGEDGYESIKGAREVDRRLIEVLGVESLSSLDHAFIEQRKLDAFIDMAPVARMNYMSKMFGEKRVTEIHSELSSKVSAYRAASLLRDEIVEATVARDRAIEDVASVEEALAKQKKYFDDTYGDSFIDERMQEISKIHEKLSVISEVTGLKTQIEDQNKKIAELNKAIEEASAKYDKITKEASAKEAEGVEEEDIYAMKQALRIVEAWEAYDARKAQFAKSYLLPAIAAFRSRPKLSSLSGVSEEDIEILRGEAADLIRELSKLEQISAFHDALKEGCPCPLCGSIVQSVEEAKKVKAANAEREKALEDEIDKLLEAAKLANRSREKDCEILRARQEIRKRIMAAKACRPQAPIEGRLEVSSDELRAIIAEKERKLADLKAIKEAAAREEAELQRLKDRLADVVSLRDSLVEAHEKRAKEVAGITEEELQNRIAAIRQEIEEAQNCKASVIELDNMLVGKRHMLEFSEKELKKLKVELKNRERLESLRSVFHPSGAISLYVKACIAEQEDVINEVLETFGARFSVRYDDSVFVASFPDGREVPDTFLSVGERLMLALGWHLALRSTTVGIPSLLCLDEPAAGLDDEHCRVLPEILVKMNEFARDRDVQVLFVTHDHLDDSLFSNVIVVDS